MSDQARPGPDDLTSKGIPTARRGYDKREIDRLLKEAARSWRALQAEHARFVAEIDRVGGLEFLARDLGSIGDDVTRLLADAQQAADGVRARARSDSEERLTSAAETALNLEADAEQQAFELRKDAWGTGSELLDQVRITIEAMIEQAEAEVLIIRAEAEQDAHRRAQAADREAREVLREARFEADRMVAEARTASAEMIEGHVVERPPPEETVDPDDDTGETPIVEGLRSGTGVRVIRTEPRRRRVPADTDGVFRAHDPGSYADAIVAEVEALHEQPESVPEEPSSPAVPEEPAGSVDAAVAAEDAALEAPEAETPTDPPAATEPDPVPEAESQPHPEPEPEPEEEAGPVDDLFARLRNGDDPEPAGDPGGTTAGTSAAPPDPAPAVPDAFDVRERLLLPVQNEALRRVKRHIVDLQNLALDAVRVDGTWEPDRATMLAGLGDALDGPILAAAESGADAVMELTGAARPPVVVGEPVAGLLRDMCDDLGGQLETAAGEGTAAGPVETAATLSRVFRAWRSDEAERWVRTVAYASYHHSLLDGLAVSGVVRVVPLGRGQPCESCPAGVGETWAPGGELPDGTVVPPARLDCVCTFAPAAP